MFCQQCGARIEDGSFFCYNCGAKQVNGKNEKPQESGAGTMPNNVQSSFGQTANQQPNASNYYTQPQQPMNNNPYQQNGYQAPVQNPYQQNGYQPPVQNPYYGAANQAVQPSMKWFNFLIYFSLFFGAVINFVFGFNFLTGGIYFVQSDGQVSADMVYSMFDGLKAVDIIYGILMIALAGFSIYTRFRLSKYKANGPMCICMVYGASAGIALLYIIAVSVITGESRLIGSNVVSIIASVVLIVLNYIYFNKRKELFVN